MFRTVLVPAGWTRAGAPGNIPALPLAFPSSGTVGSFPAMELNVRENPVSLYSLHGRNRMITQDIVRKLWDEAGYGNIAVWADDTLSVVPVDYPGETAGKKPLVILKPIALVNRYELLDFALRDEELLMKIETAIRAAGGQVTRGPQV